MTAATAALRAGLDPTPGLAVAAHETGRVGPVPHQPVQPLLRDRTEEFILRSRCGWRAVSEGDTGGDRNQRDRGEVFDFHVQVLQRTITAKRGQPQSTIPAVWIRPAGSIRTHAEGHKRPRPKVAGFSPRISDSRAPPTAERVPGVTFCDPGNAPFRGRGLAARPVPGKI